MSITKRAKTETLVLLDEEYGYRQWFWFPAMSSEELITWWRGLGSVLPHFKDPSATLPGELIEVTNSNEDEWLSLFANDNTFIGYIHEDDNSYLESPDRKRHLHRGLKSLPGEQEETTLMGCSSLGQFVEMVEGLPPLTDEQMNNFVTRIEGGKAESPDEERMKKAAKWYRDNKMEE